MPLPIPNDPIESGFAATLELGRNEAEDMSFDGGFQIRTNPHASDGSYLQATGDVSRAGGLFAGVSGYYDLTVGYFDESDGVSYMEVVVNGVVVDSFDWDSTAGQAIVVADGLQEREVLSVWLEPGDSVVLRGRRDGGEPLRTDYLDIASSDYVPPPPPPGESFVVEAETLDILSGFRVAGNPNASGDAFLQAKAGVEARALYTVEKAGTFDLTIGYFDETDGVSSMRVLLNGTEIDSFDWDSDSGTNLASPASRAEHTIHDLTLAKGDRIELVGTADGREPLRTDFLRFEPVSTAPPEPTPDVWYIDDGEVVIGLNYGTGTFSTRNTGITQGENGTLAADFNGDGFADFLRVDVTDPPELGVTDEFVFAATLFANDGTGNFAETETTAITTASLHPFLFSDSLSLAAKDAGDIDGDGDQDVLVFDQNGDTAFLLENDGTGKFTLLSRSEISSGAFMEGLIGDFDGNAAGDIVALSSPDASEVRVYVNDGAGNLSPAAGIGVTPEAHFDGQILDLDGDGDNDVLFVADGEGRGIYALLNDGTGQLEAGSIPSVVVDETGSVGLVAGGNFDGDAAIEVVSAGTSDDVLDPGLRVYEVVDTAGGKDFVLQSFDPGITGNVQAAADYDGDGDLDLLLASDARPGTLSLLLNDGNANFTDAGDALPTDTVADETHFFDDTVLV
ncbi:hypothetical protein AVO45_12830 [Ruegeria marisrubri]|uniref:VCBS repeat-containing protein n=1 Tax=Ruegeria marisrubri TaxID=1685379 RepID=A0A0X3TKC2_9RHOB|nr:VCBS repeat-containing protein [Ruegeria marisrubri]KUJ76194.1 hypothetical protein AVO45_12830 [Ruegeria marisrubri]